MQPIPSCTLAAWRLQMTSLILLILSAWQWRSSDDVDMKKRSKSGRTLLLFALSGLCLALHFAFWVLSLSLTTLTHSLLFVTSTPLWVAGWSLIMRRSLSRIEVTGLLLGAGGAVVVSVATGTSSSSSAGGSSRSPSFAGDVSALAAAIVMVGYLEVGKELRGWMPIWLYAFPVTFIAALLLSIAALIFDTGSQVPHAHIFGFTESLFLFGTVTYLALGPGVVGHCGFNFVLKYMSTLAVSLSFQLEPLIGSFIGWIFGVLAAPTILTVIGGGVMIGGTVIVIWGGENKSKSSADGS